MAIRIALTGNPNTGKTTLFNALTGSNQTVGNWPGVTVEKKEGKLKGHTDVIITDLPGVYSLSPYTLEEVVARNYVLNEKPDAILNIIDGTNLERNLYLTSQVTELGVPVVIAVNMLDVLEKSGNKLDLDKMSEKLGCPVVEISALKGTGVMEAAEKAIEISKSHTLPKEKHEFDKNVEDAIKDIIALLPSSVPELQRRWYGVKLFQRDDKAIEQLNLSESTLADIEKIITKCEDAMDDESESIITSERYNYISTVIASFYKVKNKDYVSISDKIDKIVTNRILGLPIFAAIMFAVYYISITTVGTGMTDWVNDVLFAEIIQPGVQGFLESAGVAEWLVGLIVNGIIAGVGAVIGFLPQMLTLFFFLAFLEGCGYMARIAFVMDRVFRRFGLSGKSFIPILIGTGCGVPGIMASRTIESEHDRRMTVITTTFIPCSAKLPVIALISGALFDNDAWVASSAYFVGIAAIVISGIMLKKTKLFSGDPSPFVIELPAYHLPTAGSIIRSMAERGWSFVKKAGTVITLATILIWFLSYFGFVDGSFSYLAEDQMDTSLLANIGNTFAWIFAPLGWGTWKPAVAAITGLMAKENVVGTFGILYHVSDFNADTGEGIWQLLRADYTPLSAYSYLVFNLLCAPCIAAMSAIRREMSSIKWFWTAVGYQCIFAYIVAMIIYQVGSLILTGKFGIGTIFGFIGIAAIIYGLVRKPYVEKDSTVKAKV